MDEDEQQIDFTKFKYVLYARKSRTDETAQVRSIPDQIAECEKLAKRLHLNVVKVLEEKQSAKKPHKRPIFTQMLKDLRSGVYEGILAWNPDRLARNMLEGGMLIDMIDQEQIKDLKFVTHYFTKDANGKMLLGMAFVLSKQYSDDLSQKVTRGVRRSFAEGKSPAPKHGYIRDDEGLYRPDNKNFELICDAWEMRHQGESLDVIAAYINKEGYKRTVKRSGQVITMSAKILSDVFRNPFYFGILVQGNKKVDLRELYDFKNATTEDVYNEVQQLTYKRMTPLQTKKRAAFYPLKALVKCSFCMHNMVVGPSTSKTGKRYLNYRCDNKNCTRKKKSIRAKEIFNFIYQLLEEKFRFTEKDYKSYYDSLVKLSDTQREKVQIDIHSNEGRLKVAVREIKERSLGIISLKQNSAARKINEDRIQELEEEQEDIKAQIQELQQKLTDPEADRLSLKQFLNLSKNAAAIVKSANAVVKDAICRIIFLNFVVDEQKVLSYQAKEPFATMLVTRETATSRGKRT